MTITEADYQAELTALRAEYAADLPGRLSEIETLWLALESEAWSADTLRRLHHQIHRLAGAGATFGYAGMSHAARDLEKRLLAWQRLPDRPDASAWKVAAARLAHLLASADDHPATVREEPSTQRLAPMESRLIYLVEDDAALAEEFRLLVKCSG